MEDVTDAAMRTLCYKHGADQLMTEMARIESLARKNKSTIEKTLLKDETPTWIQLVGASEPQLKKYLKDFQPHKGFQGFNMNLGCPSQNLINNGIGCAMMRRIAKTDKIIRIIKEYKYPTSIKMRLGMNEQDKQNKVYLNLINGVDNDLFIIHTRVGTDTYDKPADHKTLEACSATGKKIIANGDINSKEQVAEVLSYGAEGVMIGRSAIINPSIFATLKNKHAASIPELRKEYLELTKQFNTPQKYEKNVLKHLGKNMPEEKT
jgi:tRNA-dihydrouridine synthase